LLSGILTNLSAQAYFVPKAGWTIPSKAPVLDSFKLDSKQGLLLGLELRSGRKSIYFNPAIYAVYNKIDVFEINPLDSTQSPIFLQNTSVVWLKTKLGGTAELFGNYEIFNLHLRGGLSPGVLIIKPDFKENQLLNNSYRDLFIEFHFGIGIDFKKIILDLDYHLSLVRRVNSSDIVENTVVLNLGYMIF
jgi:hypothetical protein